jgi:hypothetical protein
VELFHGNKKNAAVVVFADAIIIDTVVVIVDTVIVAVACAWDPSVHVNFLQLNHRFSSSSKLYTLLVDSCLSLCF